MKSKVLKLIICIFLIVSIIVVQSYQAYADFFIPSLVLTAGGKALLTKLLIASGISIISIVGIIAVITLFMKLASPQVIQEINSLAENSTGVVEVSDELWDYIRNFSQSNFDIDENNILHTESIMMDLPLQSVEVHRAELDMSNGGWNMYGYSTYGTEFQYNSNVLYRVEYVGEHHGIWDRYTFARYIDGVRSRPVGTTEGHIMTPIGAPHPQIIFHAPNSDYLFPLRISVLRYTTLQGSDILTLDTLRFWELSESVPRNAFGSTYETVIGADVLSNPTWDFKDVETGKREIAFPLGGTIDYDLEQYVGKSYDDVLNEPVVNPPDGGINEGFLSGLFTGLKNFLQGLFDGLKDFLAGLLYDLFSPVINVLNTIRDYLFGDLVNLDFRGMMQSRLNYSPLQNSWAKFQNMDTSRGSPPVIRINLNSLFNASTKEFDSSRNVFLEEEYTFLDFGVLEEHEYSGLTLIDLFRTLISAGFILMTINYIWNKIHPKEVIS